jgi:hypothetical protein
MENFLSLTTAVPAFLRSLVEAGDGTRTRDPQLGRLMLYQLSYTRGRSVGPAVSRSVCSDCPHVPFRSANCITTPLSRSVVRSARPTA